ncbi:MAG: nitroreductase family protein [Solobacterium sp.]|nr:nitroreductase family protein [Solobacterium sp.]
MTFMDLCRERYSVRHYSDRPVEDEVLNQVLEAGRIAPTAANKQPQKIYVLKSEEALNKLKGLTRMVYGAPIVLLVCYDRNQSWKNSVKSFGEDYDGGEMDACIVGTQMMYAATELGLGTLWARGFNTKEVHDAFNLPENIVVSFILDLGYPAENSVNKHTPRRELSETVTVL